MSNFKNQQSSYMFSPPSLRTPNTSQNFQQSNYYPDNYNKFSAYTGQTDLSFNSVNGVAPQVFDPSEYITDGVTEKDVYICKQAFDLIDGKGEGFLNPGKIRTALKEYGKYIASIELVYQICYDFDKDMNGKIDFKEFMDMMKMRPCESDSKEDIQKVFDDINEYRDNQGITPQDIVDLAKNCGEQLSLQDAIRIVNKINPNSQTISIEDFTTFNKLCNFQPEL